MLSPTSPSASPGLVSPISQAGDGSLGPDVSMSLGARWYQRASAAHYAGGHAYTGRSCGSQPGTATTSKSAELVAKLGELDLPPPVPPLPWNTGGAPGPSGRDSVMASSIVATIASEDLGFRFAVSIEDQMEISRGSLELPPTQEHPSHPIPIKARAVYGGTFGLGIFGKKFRFGLFKHSDSNNNSIGTAAATMAASNAAPALPSAASAAAAPAPAQLLDRKVEKKMLAKMCQEEQRAQYKARARRQKESSRAVIRKREEVIERKGVKELTLDSDG
ncbi:hypothetical protein FRC04_007824 [Tulasnella sp. 424]|nr:hypothetical protein FRC04_007824 [Tulasnella sp. 424]